jgi:sulfate permease, SulP family
MPAPDNGQKTEHVCATSSLAQSEGTTVLFVSLRGYGLSWLPGDLLAATTLAAIAIPEQLATARLAGMPPMAGLFSFAAGSVAFAAFGTNRYVSVGADSTIAPIMASGLAAIAAAGVGRYPALVSLLALLVGLVLLASFLLRLGWIADLLSVPVTTGFLAGISVHIIVGQLPAVLGIEVASRHIVDELATIWQQLPHTNPLTLAIGLGVFVGTLVAERLSARIPGALIGLVASAIVVWLLGPGRGGVAVLGALPLTLPTMTLTVPSLQELARSLPLSLIVALVCIIQTAAVVQSFPAGENGREDVNRDFAALGAGSILAAVLGAFAVNASPPRTAVVQESGGRSQLASLLAVAIVAATVLLAATAFAFVPEAALGGVLLFIGVRIFRVAMMRQIYQQGGWEIWLVLASAALVVFLPIQTGITMGIVLSLLHGMYIIARPACAVLSRIPGTTVWWDLPAKEPGERQPGALVFAPGVPIYFINAADIRSKLMDAIAAAAEPCRFVVIEANGMIDIDFTGSRVLQQTILELRQRKIDVAIARLESEHAQRAAAQTGLIATLGADHVYRSVDDAIRSARTRKII